MSKNNRLPDYIEHISTATENAHNFVDGLTKEEFLNDTKTQQAVSMSLVIIGESATKIMKEHEEFAKKHDTVPWQQMRGMRNQMAHGYFEIDMDEVWKTTKTDLPKLLEVLPSILKDANSLKKNDSLTTTPITDRPKAEYKPPVASKGLKR